MNLRWIGNRLRRFGQTLGLYLFLLGAASAQNTFTTIRLDSGPLPIPPGCENNDAIREMAQQILHAYPKLMPSGRRGVPIDYVVCNDDRFGLGHTVTRRWPDGTVEATIYIGRSMAAGSLRLAVVVAHELAHVGVEAAGEKRRAGADGHGYAWLLRLIRAGLPSVAFEQVGPGGAFPQYADAYRKASLEVCQRVSCGAERIEESGLAELFADGQ